MVVELCLHVVPTHTSLVPRNCLPGCFQVSEVMGLQQLGLREASRSETVSCLLSPVLGLFGGNSCVSFLLNTRAPEIQQSAPESHTIVLS